MSRPRFLADNDLNDHIVTGVCRREPSVEFIRSREIGLANRADAEILEYAAKNDLIVVSHDVNTMPKQAYSRMTEGRTFPGLLMVRQTEPVKPVIESLLLIWASSEREEWENTVEFLPL